MDCLQHEHFSAFLKLCCKEGKEPQRQGAAVRILRLLAARYPEHLDVASVDTHKQSPL